MKISVYGALYEAVTEAVRDSCVGCDLMGSDGCLQKDSEQLMRDLCFESHIIFKRVGRDTDGPRGLYDLMTDMKTIVDEFVDTYRITVDEMELIKGAGNRVEAIKMVRSMRKKDRVSEISDMIDTLTELGAVIDTANLKYPSDIPLATAKRFVDMLFSYIALSSVK